MARRNRAGRLKPSAQPADSREWHLRGSRPPRDFRGVSTMQPVDSGRPLRGRMLEQRCAVVLQIRRQLDAQRVLDFPWLQKCPQQRCGRGVGDSERIDCPGEPAVEHGDGAEL